MRASRGMGDMRASKMPRKRTITRKDDPNEVDIYRKGGVTKKSRPPKKPTGPRIDKKLRKAKDIIPRREFT